VDHGSILLFQGVFHRRWGAAHQILADHMKGEGRNSQGCLRVYVCRSPQAVVGGEGRGGGCGTRTWLESIAPGRLGRASAGSCEVCGPGEPK
jgi:hypothetical protein